jgi:hypothetical protein
MRNFGVRCASAAQKASQLSTQGDQEARGMKIFPVLTCVTQSAREMNLPPFDTASVKTPRGSATGDHRKRRLTRQLRVKVSAADLCFENVNYAPANLLVLVVLSLSFCGVGGTLSVPIPPARWRTRQGSLDERRPAGRRLQLFHRPRAHANEAHSEKRARRRAKTLVAEVLPGMQTDTLLALLSHQSVTQRTLHGIPNAPHVMCLLYCTLASLAQGAVFLHASCENVI